MPGPKLTEWDGRHWVRPRKAYDLAPTSRFGREMLRIFSKIKPADAEEDDLDEDDLERDEDGKLTEAEKERIAREDYDRRNEPVDDLNLRAPNNEGDNMNDSFEKVCKAMVLTGEPLMSANELTEQINKRRVPVERLAGESSEQTFARLLTTDRELQKLYDIAKGYARPAV